MATADIFIHGHGTWKPVNGFTVVPKNSSITFYTHFAKLLNATMAYPILRNTFTGESERTIPAYMMVPNMTLSSLTAAQRHTAGTIFAAGAGRNLYMLPAAPPTKRVTLEAVMERFRKITDLDLELRFHWLACQHLGLKAVGGGALGVNASDRTFQTGHRGQYLLKWVDSDGIAQQKYVSSQSSIHKVHDDVPL